MFVQQGARQFEIWTGKPAPEEEMMRVVVHALRRRGNEAGIGAASSQGTSGATPPAVSDGSRGPFRKTLASVGAKLEEAATPGLRPLRGTDANHARSADSTAKNGPKKLPVPASRKAEKGTKSAPKKAASASIARKGASPARKAPAKTAPVPPAATPKVGRKATGKGKAPRIPPAAKKNTPGKDGRKKSPTSKR
jgi:3-dehydroquinate dehydratase/shikimate dehydrogenase